MNNYKTTPMMTQYFDIKKKYQDSLLFFRMGDFYEMFFEDAKIASRLLEITLTSRNKNMGNSIPMCGFPVRAVEGYIAKLIDFGKKVAVCEQVEDPSVAKGIVKREVVRVVTPGILLDEKILDEKTNNFILALSVNNDIYGLSYLDISTGTFRVTESNNFKYISEEAIRISPSEILLAERFKKNELFTLIIERFSEKSITYLEDKELTNQSGKKKLLDQFKTVSLEGFGCEKFQAGLGAAGAILTYINDTQLKKIEHLSGIESYYLTDYLIIDDVSCRNLELLNNIKTGSKSGTLIHIIDKTVTSMGGRMLKSWIRYPLFNKNEIINRLDAVDEAKKNITIRKKLRNLLKNVYDLERLASKISMGHSIARNFVALKISLLNLPEIIYELKNFKANLFICNINIDNLLELADLIEKSIREDAPPVITEGEIIKSGYDKDLDELIKISKDSKIYLAELETKEKNITGIHTLKVKYNKVFGYFIEISKTNVHLAPDNYIRKQTLVNAERYITDELKEFEDKALNAQEKRASLEYKIFIKIKDQIVLNIRSINQIAQFLAQIDCILNLSEIADENDYCRPEINKEGYIDLKESRHPVIEKLITGERYVPNDIKLDNIENQILIITGPNMAGKSTILRKVAIISLLAHMGSFVPAKRANICLIDRIFTRVGALDNLSQGQSTFMVEMEETANIMNNATAQSLVIIDEIGRGTSTFDGMSIAWAVAEFLHDINNRGVKTLFATHYHELTRLEEKKERIKNFNITVKEKNDNIIFLRKLIIGGTNKSYGIQVARLAGIPDIIIKNAKEVLLSIEKKQHNLIFDEKSNMISKQKNIQLNLFYEQEQKVIKKIQKLNLAQITPIEALNILNEIQKKI